MKNKHRIKQGLALLLAGGVALTNLGAGLPAFAENAAATPETAQTATLDPDAAVLYADLPDAPAGSYIGSEGLPVATGQTKIGLSLWADGQLEQDSHLDPDALNSGDKTVTVPLTEDTDYAIVPLMAQVEYPADGSRTDVLLPENVTLLDYDGEPAQDTTVLHSEYAETSAAATGLYLLTDEDFTAQLVYTAPDGNALTQNLNVVIDRSSTAVPPFADMGVAPYAGRPTPSVTSGRITKVAKVNATWLIWFNGEPAYCCTHGANGQPNGCPPYSYSHTSTVGADQCIPGDHYGNQIRIWGGLNQLSLDEDGDFPAVFCAEYEAELSVSDFCEMIYDDLQLYIMQHYPDSRAAALYRESAEELLNGVQTYTAEAGYYTYIYQPAASGWQTVALIGPAIEGEEPEPEPVPQEYYADWQAPAQTAGGSFDLTFTVNTDKVQLNTLEKVDGAVITVTPSRTGGSVDGGNWQMSPAGAQTITTSGHTQDDTYHLNGGDGSATWTVHYEVSKTSTSTLSGQEGPFTSQAEADAAAEAAKNAAMDKLAYLLDEYVFPLAFDGMPADDAEIILNPSGKFVQGGPDADTGLTGRKLMVDSYGTFAPHGGGAFSGKDATKVDRSGAYMARYIAKNMVAAHLADRCQVTLAYAIGEKDPVMVDVNTFGTGICEDDCLAAAVRKAYDLTQAGIIKQLNLLNPMYSRTAAGGHFGREDFPWENVEHMSDLAAYIV